MINRTAIAGCVALVFLAACSKQETTGAAEDLDTAERPSAAAAIPQKAKEDYDYAKLANGMLPLVAERPECQRFRDELQAIAATPAGSAPPRDPSHVVADAHSAGCSTKSTQ
jgi:hypothetical protein